MWAPNCEKDIVLACGCIDLPWGAIYIFGEKRWSKGELKGKKKYRLTCRNGHGEQLIIRQANTADSVAYDSRQIQGTLFA